MPVFLFCCDYFSLLSLPVSPSHVSLSLSLSRFYIASVSFKFVFSLFLFHRTAEKQFERERTRLRFQSESFAASSPSDHEPFLRNSGSKMTVLFVVSEVRIYSNPTCYLIIFIAFCRILHLSIFSYMPLSPSLFISLGLSLKPFLKDTKATSYIYTHTCVSRVFYFVFLCHVSIEGTLYS